MYLYLFLSLNDTPDLQDRQEETFKIHGLTESWSDESSDLQFHGQTDPLLDRIDAQHLDTDHIPYADRL